VLALFDARGRGERRHAHVARVERRQEPLDRPALARRVPALEEDAHRRPDVAVADQAAERQAQRREPPLGGLEALRLLLAGGVELEVELVEAPPQAAAGTVAPTRSASSISRFA
jgi:hypothetical protein